VHDQWFTDYTKLSASAAIFYGYTFVVGLGVWLVLRYFRSDMRLAHMFCIYGGWGAVVRQGRAVC